MQEYSHVDGKKSPVINFDAGELKSSCRPRNNRQRIDAF